MKWLSHTVFGRQYLENATCYDSSSAIHRVVAHHSFATTVSYVFPGKPGDEANRDRAAYRAYTSRGAWGQN